MLAEHPRTVEALIADRAEQATPVCRERFLISSARRRQRRRPGRVAMSDERVHQVVEFECLEEGRTAQLHLEWEQALGTRRLVGVHCDNPKLASLDNWQCSWSCWKKVEERFRDQR
jgi:hypothetical protein